MFVSESSLVGAGYDCQPYLFQASAGAVKLVKSLDAQKEAAAGGTTNLKMWQNMDKKGESAEVEKLKTKHQNAITHMVEFNGGVVTCGCVAFSCACVFLSDALSSPRRLDGQIITWPKP